MSIGTPNLVEADEIVKGLPDDALRKAAQFGHQMVPPVVALHEITRRKDMRQRYEKARNKMPDATIKDQILGANPLDGGVMSNVPQMPQQMAARPPMPQPPMQPPMNPQMMAQRPPMPPQMPPQGMMPQMASTGAVVRASNGQRIDFNQGTPVDTVNGRSVDFRGEMQRLAEEREMLERIARNRSKFGYSNEYLGEENIDQLVGDNIPYKDFVAKQDEEAFLNPSDQGIGTGNAIREDAENFIINQIPSGYGELSNGGIDPDWKTPREQYYGDNTIPVSTAGNAGWSIEETSELTDLGYTGETIESDKPFPGSKLNPDTGLYEKFIPAEDTEADADGNAILEEAPSARQERDELLTLAREKAFELSDDDIAAFRPSRDDILADFLMKYGAELAGGDHAEGLRQGVAAVGARKKEARSADQLQMLTNLKLKQQHKTGLLDSLYKAGSLDLSELTANVQNEVEMGRTLRALVDAYQHLGNDSTWISSLNNSDLKAFYDERRRAFQRLASHDEMMRARLAKRSTGGIASVR